MDDAHRGEAALKDGKYEEAITLYTKAIQNSPTSPAYLIKRSTAYQRLKQYQDARDDADSAVIYATRRGKRELMAQAQLRRGIAYFFLEQYGDADFLFQIVKKLDDKEKSVGIWQSKTKTKLGGLEADDPKSQVTVKETPDLPVSKDTKGGTESNGASKAASEPIKEDVAPSQEKKAVQTPASQIRHDWYQNNDNVYFTLMARGVPKDQASIDIQSHSLSISFPLTTGSMYDISLEPLFAPIDPAISAFKVMSTKIEVTLKKKNPGQKWSSLEGTTTGITDTANASPSDTTRKGPASASGSGDGNAKGPVYPTSARGGPKNWDKIAADYTRPAASKSDEDDAKAKKDDGIYVDDFDDEGDEANAFFKKLYKDADPDTRRAMMKSYQESGGTALSTNWEEVKKKKTEISPPEGMEAKTWEY